MGIFGEYVENSDPSSDNAGYLFGGTLGHKKVGAKGQWRVLLAYRELEKDAWYDFLPDSDFYDGKTGVKGYEGIIEYALLDNLTIGFDYYSTENMSGTIKESDLYQLDMVWKF
jgi:hypothetical protein